MSAQHATKGAMVPISQLQVPESYVGKPHKVDDETLYNSIQLTGIQQPLIVVRLMESNYLVIDGVRRLGIARALDLAEVPCVIDLGVEEAEDPAEYRNRVRFILDEHRQDLSPTQRAALIKKLQQTFEMTAKQVALYLGVSPGTITNWTLIDDMIPEIQRAIDGDEITLHTARAFAGMSKSGQHRIWTDDHDAVKTMSSASLHRWVRERYSPDKFPDMYKWPEMVMKQLARKNATRKGQKRTKVSVDEKKTLLKDVDAKKIELKEKVAQIQEFDRQIVAAIDVIGAIREQNELWDSLPNSIRSDFEEFTERFIPAPV